MQSDLIKMFVHGQNVGLSWTGIQTKFIIRAGKGQWIHSRIIDCNFWIIELYFHAYELLTIFCSKSYHLLRLRRAGPTGKTR